MNKPDSKTLARWGAVFMAVIALGWVGWLVASGKAVEFWGALTGADVPWVIAGMLCFAAYFLLDALCFRIAGTLTGVRMGFLDLISTAASGIVFGYLTPGQMGAAPAQIVRLSKAGLTVGDASAIQLTRFFVYQSAVTIFGATMLLVKFRYFKGMFGNVTLIAALAFCVHLGIMLMLVGLIFFPNLIRRIARFGVRLLSERLRVIKDPQAILDSVEGQIDQYDASVHAAVRHVGVMTSAIVITTLQLIAIYSIPHCVLRALGVVETDAFTDVAAAAFVQLILTAVPLPGGTGGAEGGFALFFGPSLGDLTATGVILWRLISFYLPVLVSFPLLALKSSVSPEERLRRYGEAKVGRAAIADDVHTAREQVSVAREHVSARRSERAGTSAGESYRSRRHGLRRHGRSVVRHGTRRGADGTRQPARRPRRSIRRGRGAGGRSGRRR